jgi:hypothetical protein
MLSFPQKRESSISISATGGFAFHENIFGFPSLLRRSVAAKAGSDQEWQKIFSAPA